MGSHAARSIFNSRSRSGTSCDRHLGLGLLRCFFQCNTIKFGRILGAAELHIFSGAGTYLYPSFQECRNVTQIKGASATSISSRVKRNLSMMDVYADLCFPRRRESFSVYKLCFRKKGKILRIILAEKRGGHGPRGPPPIPTPMLPLAGAHPGFLRGVPRMSSYL